LYSKAEEKRLSNRKSCLSARKMSGGYSFFSLSDTTTNGFHAPKDKFVS
jgi:hypothetical protein